MLHRLLGGVAMGAAGVLLLAAARPAAAEILEEIAARVNDSIITRSDLEARRTQVAAQLSAQLQGAELEQQMQDFQDRALYDIINEELLIQRASLNFDMDKYYDNVKQEFKRANGIDTDEALEEMLTNENMNMREFKRILLRNNVPQDVIQFEVTRKISVSPAEIRAYYDKHASDFREAGEVTLLEIVILDSARGNEAARALMDDIMARLAAGEDFGALAKELSESPSRERSGRVGPYLEGDLSPALAEQAFSLAVGQVGEPIATSYGFHLLQVESRNDSRMPPVEELDDELEAQVRREKYGVALDTFLARLWRENQVVVNSRYTTGRLTDGGPFATLEELVPEDRGIGVPPAPDPDAAQAPAAPDATQAPPAAPADPAAGEGAPGG